MMMSMIHHNSSENKRRQTVVNDLEMKMMPPPPPPPPLSLTHSPPQSATKIFANLLVHHDGEVEFYKNIADANNQQDIMNYETKSNGGGSSDDSSHTSSDVHDDFDEEVAAAANVTNLGRVDFLIYFCFYFWHARAYGRQHTWWRKWNRNPGWMRHVQCRSMCVL